MRTRFSSSFLKITLCVETFLQGARGFSGVLPETDVALRMPRDCRVDCLMVLRAESSARLNEAPALNRVQAVLHRARNARQARSTSAIVRPKLFEAVRRIIQDLARRFSDDEILTRPSVGKNSPGEPSPRRISRPNTCFGRANGVVDVGLAASAPRCRKKTIPTALDTGEADGHQTEAHEKSGSTSVYQPDGVERGGIHARNQDHCRLPVRSRGRRRRRAGPDHCHRSTAGRLCSAGRDGTQIGHTDRSRRRSLLYAPAMDIAEPDRLTYYIIHATEFTSGRATVAEERWYV